MIDLNLAATVITILVFTIGIAKFLAEIYKDRADIRDVKEDIRKMTVRLATLNEENMKISTRLDYFEKKLNNYFEKRGGRK